MQNFPTSFVLAALLFFSCQKELSAPDEDETLVAQQPKKEYVIDASSVIWGDEFSESGALDPKKWGFDLGGNGFGNNESQFYTDRLKNARVENGQLIIEALLENYEGRNYTSARVVSKNKGDFKYGRFEIKAKLPSGTGTWPALWMLATKSSYGDAYWPDNGEIDIMEHVGFDQNVVHGNVHTKAFNHSIGTNKGNRIPVDGTAEKFHIYAVNWLPDRIDFEIDGQLYFTFTNETAYGWQQWPFDQPFHLLMNIAVGGNWGGQKGIDNTIFPQRMSIDYVRVYGIKKK